jgi:hypothetical protein
VSTATPDRHGSRRPLTLRRRVGSLLLAAVVSAAIGWAARTGFIVPDVPLSTDAPMTATATLGSVGREVTFAATIGWEGDELVRGRATGTLTAVHVDATTLLDVGDVAVDVGDVVVDVDLMPVVAAQGAIATSRAMGPGDRGADVRQLQELLQVLGLYDGTAGGTFGTSTRAAVTRWQQQLEVSASGTVADGMVLFPPELPVRVAPAPEVAPGVHIGGSRTRKPVRQLGSAMQKHGRSSRGVRTRTCDHAVTCDGSDV